jgi:hypothetical protein
VCARPDVLMAIDEGCGKVADALLVAVLRNDDVVLPNALQLHKRVKCLLEVVRPFARQDNDDGRGSLE